MHIVYVVCVYVPVASDESNHWKGKRFRVPNVSVRTASQHGKEVGWRVETDDIEALKVQDPDA